MLALDKNSSMFHEIMEVNNNIGIGKRKQFLRLNSVCDISGAINGALLLSPPLTEQIVHAQIAEQNNLNTLTAYTLGGYGNCRLKIV